jgi:hypothetical protein
MSAKKDCRRCLGKGIEETGNNDLLCRCVKPASFDALHAVYHERDFRVRVNDPTINFVARILAEEVGLKNTNGCAACAAGYEPFALQPNASDR